MFQNKTPRLLFAFLTVLSLFVFSRSASAESLEVDVAGYVAAADEGSETLLLSVPIEEDLVGKSCEISVVSANQVSIHPGNDLVVRSAGEEAVIEGIEDSTAIDVEHPVSIYIGEDIDLYLRMGPDEASSINIGMRLDCEDLTPVASPPPAEATAPPVSSTTTTVAATTSSVSTASSTTISEPATVASTVASTTTEIAKNSVIEGSSTGNSLEEVPPAPVAKAVTAEPTYTG